MTRVLLVALTGCAWVALLGAPGVEAQRVVERSAVVEGVAGAPPVSVVDPTSAPADASASQPTTRSEWLLWRVFHDSLRFYRDQSPTKVRLFLGQRIGVTERQVDILLNEGDAYLERLAAIDEEARRAVAARYRPQLPPPPLADLPVPQGRQSVAGLDASSLIGAQGRGGRELYQALKQDGFIARVELR